MLRYVTVNIPITIIKVERLVIKMQKQLYRESAVLIIIKIVNKRNVFKKLQENE